jgi:hypothetical protein
MAEEKKDLSVQVTKNQVFDTKNPGVKMVSWPDPSSANGFSSFPVPSDSVSGEGKMRTVTLDPERKYDISKPVIGEDGKKTFVHEPPITGEEIFNRFEANKQKAIAERTAQAEAPAPEKAKDVYVNRVSDKLIHPTKDENLMRVSFPDDRSTNGMGNALIPKANIFPARNSNREIIPGRSSINLGSPDNAVTYSVRNDQGKFMAVPMTAGELAERYADSQKAFVAGQRTAAKQAPDVVTPEAKSDLTDEMVIE